MALAVVGSQLPDLDTTTSVIGQIAFPVSSWIEDRYPHRTITHSLVATVAIASLSVVRALYAGTVGSDYFDVGGVATDGGFGRAIAGDEDCSEPDAAEN